MVPINIIVSVHLSALISTDPTGWISVIFVIEDFYENLKTQIWLELDQNVGYFTGRPKCISYC